MDVERPAQFPNTHYDIVALAASAGGLNALSQVLGALPVDFPAPVLVVQHLEPHRLSKLAMILGRKTALTVQQAEDGNKIIPGMVYIAPPNYHMRVDHLGCIRLDQSERKHFTRPAIDPLFESMAENYGSRIIVVVLSGMGRDGSKGILAVKAGGGEVIAQDLATSDFTGMPGAAIRTGKVDFILPLEFISAAITSLVKSGVYS